MKHIYLLLPIFIMLTACSEQNDFKFKGELPTEKYVIMQMNEDASDFDYIDGETIDLRNRIYLFIDSTDHVLLNGHTTSLRSFYENLKYVMSNPDQLSHLPKQAQQAVIFTNVRDFDLEQIESDKAGVFKRQLVTSTLNSVYISLLMDYLIHDLGRDWDSFTEEDLNKIEKKFVLRMAIPAKNNLFDKGLSLKLPKPNKTKTNRGEGRNILKVKVDKNNVITIQEKVTSLEKIQALAKDFILNPLQKANLAASPQKAIISLKNDKETNYEVYLEVYDALNTAYDELWEEAAQGQFGKAYKDLDSTEKKEIRTAIPFLISEAEPTGFD